MQQIYLIPLCRRESLASVAHSKIEIGQTDLKHDVKCRISRNDDTGWLEDINHAKCEKDTDNGRKVSTERHRGGSPQRAP